MSLGNIRGSSQQPYITPAVQEVKDDRNKLVERSLEATIVLTYSIKEKGKGDVISYKPITVKLTTTRQKEDVGKTKGYSNQEFQNDFAKEMAKVSRVKKLIKSDEFDITSRSIIRANRQPRSTMGKLKDFARIFYAATISFLKGYRVSSGYVSVNDQGYKDFLTQKKYAMDVNPEEKIIELKDISNKTNIEDSEDLDSFVEYEKTETEIELKPMNEREDDVDIENEEDIKKGMGEDLAVDQSNIPESESEIFALDEYADPDNIFELEDESEEASLVEDPVEIAMKINVEKDLLDIHTVQYDIQKLKDELTKFTSESGSTRSFQQISTDYSNIMHSSNHLYTQLQSNLGKVKDKQLKKEKTEFLESFKNEIASLEKEYLKAKKFEKEHVNKIFGPDLEEEPFEINVKPKEAKSEIPSKDVILKEIVQLDDLFKTIDFEGLLTPKNDVGNALLLYLKQLESEYKVRSKEFTVEEYKAWINNTGSILNSLKKIENEFYDYQKSLSEEDVKSEVKVNFNAKMKNFIGVKNEISEIVDNLYYPSLLNWSELNKHKA